ncbi:cellulose binding domain-containing protein [Actinomadura sp. HBU206391]|uniref:cellulose binding domain-containing protein n=1 Tax=Actinomadura sp. HBU206391 TaxID=2731692 RepID=UPI00164FA640|nr:cellulose binding domain-containing protein [Actinomadura sp. HBU206391]MBC6463707.1 cellulose binding domain-containing protein [Actinomadura sp. HBU206391]
MGRHTKFADDLDPEGTDLADAATEQPRQDKRMGWVTKVPLLPAIAGLGAIGVVAAAWSTSQISLNFAGGAPAVADRPQAQAQDSSNTRPRLDDRTSRSDRTSAVTIAFRATSRSATGFRATATIANHGTQPINGWTLKFRIPNAQVVGATNVVLVQPGATATVRNPAHAPTIAPGRSVQLVFTAEGAASKPSACRFNGVACTLD